AIKNKGVMAGPENGHQKFALVAAKDISQVAYNNLHALDFKGKSVQYVLGERDLSYNEIGEVYGRAIGNPNLKYYQVCKDEFFSTITQMRASRKAASKIYEFNKRINQWKVTGFDSRTKEKSTQTSIEEFANSVFKSAFEGQ